MGVVSSPGLDLVNQYFEIGAAFSQQALHSVFGTREDLKNRLLGGSEPTTQLIQVGLKPDRPPASATPRPRPASARPSRAPTSSTWATAAS